MRLRSACPWLLCLPTPWTGRSPISGEKVTLAIMFGITDGLSVFTCSFLISFYSDVTAHCGGLGQTPRPRSPASTTSRTELASPPGIIRGSSWNYLGFFVSRVHTVVVSTQHSEKVTLEALRKDIMEKVVLATIPKQYITPETKYHINPCGNFVIGGEKSLKSVCKLLWIEFRTHGRCWSYWKEDHCRHLRRLGSSRRWKLQSTKNICSCNMIFVPRRCFLRQGLHEGGQVRRLRRSLGRQVPRQGRPCQEVPGAGNVNYQPRFINSLIVCSVDPTSLQVSYAIGVAEPLSVTVFDYGTGSKSSAELNDIVKKNFDLRYNKTFEDKFAFWWPVLFRPGRIVKDLKLKNPIFQQTASYGELLQLFSFRKVLFTILL